MTNARANARSAARSSSRPTRVPVSPLFVPGRNTELSPKYIQSKPDTTFEIKDVEDKQPELAPKPKIVKPKRAPMEYISHCVECEFQVIAPKRRPQCPKDKSFLIHIPATPRAIASFQADQEHRNLLRELTEAKDESDRAKLRLQSARAAMLKYLDTARHL